MSRGADHPASTSVPTEIWGLVAKYLTLREYCMLASTCKALWTMDLQCVIVPSAKEGSRELTPEHSASALAWAAKRWTCAQLLEISIRHGNMKALSKALASSQHLTHLEELHVDNEGGDSKIACEIACAWLLTQARNIKVLNANVTCLDSFGAARGLEHLMLEISGADCDCLSSSLSVLERLETLRIDNTASSQQQTSGALHLTALQSLQSVALVDYVPETIQLAENCELHVAHLTLFGAEHAVWDTVLPHLRSVVLYIEGHELRALPSCVLNASNLAAVWVEVEGFGHAAAPLQLHGALAHVVELTIHCGHLHAVVPSGVSWRYIDFSARGMLDLRFEALSSFAEAIPALCFRYRSLQGLFVPGFVELAAVLANRQPDWKGHFIESGNISGLCFPLARPPCSMEFGYICRCEACLYCLADAGVLVPCPLTAAWSGLHSKVAQRHR